MAHNDSLVADSGGRGHGRAPLPGPVKISHKKMATKGSRIDFMFLTPPPSTPAAGSATGIYTRAKVTSVAICCVVFNLCVYTTATAAATNIKEKIALTFTLISMNP